MKTEEFHELRIGERLTQKELAAHLGVDRRTVGPSKDSQITLRSSHCDSSTAAPLLSYSSGAYVNLVEAPLPSTSLAESLIMRNLIRFLRSGMSRLMGKNTPKGRQYYILSDIVCVRAFILPLAAS